MEAANKEIIEEANKTFNDTDIEAFLTYCMDEVTWEMAGENVMKGKDEIRKAMGSSPFDSMRNVVKRIIAEGDQVVVEGIVTMTKDGADEHQAAYCDIYKLKNGKIIDLISYVRDLDKNVK